MKLTILMYQTGKNYKADAEAECNILRKALDKIAEIKSLLEERRIGELETARWSDGS